MQQVFVLTTDCLPKNRLMEGTNPGGQACVFVPYLGLVSGDLLPVVPWDSSPLFNTIWDKSVFTFSKHLLISKWKLWSSIPLLKYKQKDTTCQSEWSLLILLLMFQPPPLAFVRRSLRSFGSNFGRDYLFTTWCPHLLRRNWGNNSLRWFLLPLLFWRPSWWFI